MLSAERATNGTLIDDRVDTSGPCGVAYFKGISYSREVAEFSNAAIVVPRGASIVEVEWSSLDVGRSSQRRTARVTASEVFVLPARCPHVIRGKSCIFDVLVVLPSPDVLAAVAETYAVGPERVSDVFGRAHSVARSVWVNELQHRYFFERFVCRKRENQATAFLECELTKEIYFRSSEGSKTTCAPPLLEANTLGKRAAAYIETHLFDATLNVETVASHVHASRSTLERAFKEQAWRSPNEYIRNRRLDEANALIATGRLPVGQVASLVGYQNFSAFSQAFKRRFKVSPSQLAEAKTDVPELRAAERRN